MQAYGVAVLLLALVADILFCFNSGVSIKILLLKERNAWRTHALRLLALRAACPEKI